MDLILKPFAWLLLILYHLVDNYGLALILFAVLVKIILFPFSLKGKKGMIKMNLLTSKTKQLEKKYGNNRAKYNEELQKLYQEEKVNPMGGCLWTMLPLFILIPLYGVIRQPLHYMMGLSAEQISAVAEALNWQSVALEAGWIKEAAAYQTAAYNELYLASLIHEGNLATVQAAVGESLEMFSINFNFLGIDLSQVPTWKFWSNGLNWTTIGLFLLVLVSALSGFISSKVSMKTNNLNAGEQSAQMAQTSKTMMWTMPLMSLWIGFMMPGLLCVYWIANNILAMLQELIAGRMLKKDYEEAARQQAEAAAREKEEEKLRRRENAERRAREAEEAKRNKKKGLPTQKDPSKQDLTVSEVSRVGMRPYARGRAYDPDRFGGVTPYVDPFAPRGEESEAVPSEEETSLTSPAEMEQEQPQVEQVFQVEQALEEVSGEVPEEAAEEEE